MSTHTVLRLNTYTGLVATLQELIKRERGWMELYRERESGEEEREGIRECMVG